MFDVNPFQAEPTAAISGDSSTFTSGSLDSIHNPGRGLLERHSHQHCALHAESLDNVQDHKPNRDMLLDSDNVFRQAITKSSSKFAQFSAAVDILNVEQFREQKDSNQDALTGLGRSQTLVGRNAALTEDSDFSIQVNLGPNLQGLTLAARDAIAQAAEVWEEVIAGSTFNGDHRLVINVSGEYDYANPGKLASAGWSELAQDAYGDWMPVLGLSYINMVNAGQYNSDPEYLFSTMVHEFGHVLGIGTLWEGNGRNLVDEATGTYYANTAAGEVYGQLLGVSRPVAVPLTIGEGEGSDLSHWREDVFDYELMTHAAEDPGAYEPLSELTIASLVDIGWFVDYSAAKEYSLPIFNSTVV